jgi:hypothetical protein
MSGYSAAATLAIISQSKNGNLGSSPVRLLPESLDKGVLMALSVRTVNYFYTRIQAEPGEPYELLARLADEDVNLLAFSAVPYGPNHLELTIFPDRIDSFLKVAKELGLVLTGPQHAVLINGDDHLGTLAEVLKTLLDAGVDIYASTGVTDGQGGYGGPDRQHD